jgi:hypothetical protein
MARPSARGKPRPLYAVYPRDQAGYRAALDRLEQYARSLTPNGSEVHGNSQALGFYLLSLILEEKGEREAAAAHRQKALGWNPRVPSAAILQAQLDYAAAHQ